MIPSIIPDRFSLLHRSVLQHALDRRLDGLLLHCQLARRRVGTARVLGGDLNFVTLRIRLEMKKAEEKTVVSVGIVKKYDTVSVFTYLQYHTLMVPCSLGVALVIFIM